MSEVVVDTTVLRKADVHLKPAKERGALLAKRIGVLERINRNELAVLISARLIAEYASQVSLGKNDVVKLFLELLTKPDGTNCISNWPAWRGAERDLMTRCRFPPEDVHVLRTAYRNKPTFILTEEGRMLTKDECVYRRFRVHIQRP